MAPGTDAGRARCTMSHKPFLRRGLALSSFALTLGLLALAGPSCGPVVTAGDCPDGFTDCDGTCANLEASENHCGACDNACADGVACSNGACEGSAACPPGLIDCGGACVDPGVHPSHCGACFNACPPDAVCSEGACVDDGCAPGLVSCFGFCTDIYYDPNNCGSCGISCDLDAACDGGVCTTAACPPGFTYCGGVCVDLASSPEHCGSCFAGCGLDETCSGGACVGCSASGGVCGACDVQVLGAQVPQTVSGDTTNRPNVLVPTCVPSQSGESGYLFTAPAADTYVFNTLSSMYDTVLHVRDLACGELACNDDAGGSVGSQVLVQLAAGQQVLVVVDGFGIEEGPYTLHINTAGVPPPPSPSARP